MSTELPDAQGCKERAIGTLRQFEKIDRNADGAIFALQLLGQVAQVWATLATVPEPLEVTELQECLVEPPQFRIPAFPTLVCPHGYQAKIEVDEGAGDGQMNMLKYTWVDCEICP